MAISMTGFEKVMTVTNFTSNEDPSFAVISDFVWSAGSPSSLQMQEMHAAKPAL